MTLDSPILALWLTPVAVLALLAAGRWLSALPRWLLRAAVLLLLAAIVGPGVRWERPLNVAVIVDVSPSTRGATFRDPLSLKTRLTPLLAGRPYTVHYFADGLQPTATEPAAKQTRLEVSGDADAVVLLSDGRFERPANAPPTFAVMDPALDAPADARVRGVRRIESGLAVDVISAGPGRPLQVNDSPIQTPAAGPAVVAVPWNAPKDSFDRVGYAAGDLWPENDAVRVPAMVQAVTRWAVDRSLPGFNRVATAKVSPHISSYLNVSSIVVPSAEAAELPLPAALGYVRTMGGTLVVAGSLDALPAPLRVALPLAMEPPAGPQDWIVLLDASGSMASADGTATRWARAIAAAQAAVDRLPDKARVTLLRFAGDVRPMAQGVSAVEARQVLAAAAGDAPSGPTGLRAALESLAKRTGELSSVSAAARSAARVLLLTDGDAELGDVDALAQMLKASQLTVSAVVAAPSNGLSKLCVATGGRVTTSTAPADWSRAFGGLTRSTDVPTKAAETLTGAGLFTGRSFASSARWTASLKEGAELLMTANGEPAAAAWKVGDGQVVAIAAELSDQDLAAIATKLDRVVVDPRFAATFDEAAEQCVLMATDAHGPMNGLKPQLIRRDDIRNFTQTAPGRYTAVMPRMYEPSIVMVRVKKDVVATQQIIGQYAPEFDAIGNDRDALAEIARTTGGAVIAAGDHRPIAFPIRREVKPIRTALLVASIAFGLAAVFFLRRSSSVSRIS
ncbi:MAG: domain containing CoxE-like protein [Phycisphaerales bacterium]|nr:domain containing CoxE-like protein [Phycisphaerales bacterium]